jgi:hypothetical protein
MTDSAFLGIRTTAERSSMDLVHPTAFFSMMGDMRISGKIFWRTLPNGVSAV